LFFKNNMYKNDKSLNLYLDFLNRYINDTRLKANGYIKKTIIIPVSDWALVNGNKDIEMYNKSTNPISLFYRMIMKQDIQKLKDVFGNYDFVFLGDNAYFKLNLMEFEKKNLPRFLSHINKLALRDFILSDKEDMDAPKGESDKSIAYNTIDKLEGKIEINNLTGTSNEPKDELVKRINKAAVSSNSPDDALKELDKDKDLQEIVKSMLSEEDGNIDINVSRSKRMSSLQQNFKNLKIDDVPISMLLDKDYSELESTEFKVDTINDDWDSLKAINFDNDSNSKIRNSIFETFDSLNSEKKQIPLAIRDVDKVDASTTEDFIDTYTIKFEDKDGKRYQIKLDIPQFVDDKFLMLKGNRKTIVKQMLLLPISKTNEDTVQVVSNYNKITITRFGNKAYYKSDLFLKGFEKIKDKNPSITYQSGDATNGNAKYNVPIDYAEIAENYTKISIGNVVFYFDQEAIREDHEFDDKLGFPIGYNKKNKTVLYVKDDEIVSDNIYMIFMSELSDAYIEEFTKVNKAKKYTYSRASIMNSKIPLIVVLAYNEGLLKVIEKSGTKYSIVEKRPKKSEHQDIIKFKDGYLVYDITYESSMLLNGLKECNTEDYEIIDLKSKRVYLDWLEIFGNRYVADGIDNFYELLIDPITQGVLIDYNLPTEFTEVLLYANNLLIDNKKIDHTYMPGRRIRSSEIISALTYKAIADAYGEYKRDVRRNKKDAKLSIDQQAVTKAILSQRIVSDFSVLNAASEIDDLNAVSYKGPSGLNLERAYGLDKRAYDKSMQNILAISTINSANVGINRQLTIDANISNSKGYINTIKDTSDLGAAKSFSFSEALTPLGNTHDDPNRTAMGSVQLSHGMRVKDSSPLLVTNGADQILPYVLSNTFVFKSKEKGKVIEKTDDYMIIEYHNGKKEFINLKTKIEKNSNAGFYVPLKLETDLKKGSLFKANQILAHDPLSFSNQVGHTDDQAYNIGTFCKIAIMNSDDGFEDSAIISENLAERMASDVIVKKAVVLGKNANIYNMRKAGDKVREGDPLMVIQNSYDEKDINIILKNLTDDEDVVSDLGKIPIKSKITGEVQEVKAFRTVDMKELSGSLQKNIRLIEKPLKDLKKVMKEYDIEAYEKFLDPTDTLEQDGRLKNVEEGVLFEFYLKYHDKMSIGDKLTFFVALKGIVRDIFPEGKEPYSEFRWYFQLRSI